MTDSPLPFVGAPAGITLTARWVYPGGWTLHVGWRREGGEWESSERSAYTELCTEELADALEAATWQLMGWLRGELGEPA